MSHIFRDLRYAIRSLLHARLFAAIAIGSLALGIGANGAIFSLVDQVLLRRLPVREPDQLVLLSRIGSHYGSNRGSSALSFPLYQDLREHNQVFTDLFCRFSFGLSVSAGGDSERAYGELVSGTYFQVLGVSPAIGRLTLLCHLLRGGFRRKLSASSKS